MTRSVHRLVIALFVGLFLAGTASAQTVAQIAAVVNDDIISVADVSKRIRLALATSGIPDTQEARNRIAPQVLRSLIDERLRIQEAKRLGISVSQEEINRALADIARQNGVSLQQLPNLLGQLGVSMDTLADQIVAEIAWSKIVQRQLRPQVEIGEAEVDEVLERIKANAGKTEAHVAEIFLGVDTPDQDASVRQVADRLVEQLRSGADFGNVARQFSQSATAATGGDLGWVLQGQLAPELDAAVAQLQPGQLSAPVRTFDGYHIVLLRDRRTVTGEEGTTRDAIRNALGNARLDLLQRRYLRDLRREAFVDVRI